MSMRRAIVISMVVVVMAGACSDDGTDTASVVDVVGETSTTQHLVTNESTTTGPSITVGVTATTTPVTSPGPFKSGTLIAPSTPSSPTEVLAPADTALPPSGSISVNDSGQPVTLDETASLACALVDVAAESSRVDDIDEAINFLRQAAQRAEPSSVEDISDEANAMRSATTDTAPRSERSSFAE